MNKELLNKISIYTIGNNDTINFSGYELKRYLDRVLQGMVQISLEERETYDPLKDHAIWLGLNSWFESNFEIVSSNISEVEDPLMDDYILIDIKNAGGIIAGSNERSVLLGIYRFLTELGCRWVRPGIDGEFIPVRNISDMNVCVDEKAAYRHRGLCIEGAVSYENVADMIDWAPKVGFNSYFIQFREAYTFFERWYTHRNNPKLESKEFPIEMARQYVNDAKKEIKKRGLIYHAVGHGWTCEPFGIPGLGWDSKEYNIAPEIRRYLAEVNGKREIWGGVPLNTNLCYSNIEVRKTIVNSIAEYLKEHCKIGALHFWLADGSNNHCECDSCREAYPSDFYVMMLNELDEILTKEGIKTKVVFLIYVDLLWAPQREKINNPDRFILMFAPISRTYSKEFNSKYDVEELPKYERNKTKCITNVEENIGFLRSWQNIFKGDSFDFDYHFMWDHYNDPGYCQIADILSRDIKNLKDIGLNGLISCQTQRAFFPTGLGMYVMARILWNDRLDFNEVTKDYFSSAFGEDGEKCKEYLSSLSELFDPSYMRNEKPQVSPDTAEKFSRIVPFINNFLPVIEKNIGQENKCRAQSWVYLRHHADICKLLASILEAWALGDKEEVAERLKGLVEMVRIKEMDLQQIFDVWNFVGVMEGRFSA